MAWLVFGITGVVGLILIIRGLRSINSRMAFKFILWIFGGITAGILTLIAIRGGIGYAIAAGSFILPLFLRWRQVRQYFKNMKGPSSGTNSGVETRYFRMTLDHDTGELDGLILFGKYKGRKLSQLPLELILELLAECRVNDPNSTTVLEAYLDRVHGTSWRSAEAANDTSASSSRNGSMTHQEALEILGLSEGASLTDIKRAHREMMKKHHPDQGGSNYMASKLNQAKSRLLKNR